MIRLHKIRCGYGKHVVLNDVSVSIEKAKLTCILGKNGVGKTTLFKTILGLLPALNGRILYDGKEREFFSGRDFAKYISYVPQAHGTPFPFTVLDVVLMGQYVHAVGIFGKPAKANVDIALWCIQKLGIENLTNRYFSKISGGEKQMVLIARAMAQQPQYIAMDEPTASLDMGNQARVMQLAGMLVHNGYGVIMNTHSPQQALQYADSVLMLRNGTVAEKGSPEEVLDSGTISQLYGTPLDIIETCTSTGDKRKILIAL